MPADKLPPHDLDAEEAVIGSLLIDGSAVYQGLLRRGVIVRPVANYGLPQWLRVTIGLAEENDRFIAALREVLQGAGA